MRGLGAAVPLFASLLGACAYTPGVERAYDGRVVSGRFIEPDAYAAFLRGSIAQASGDAAGADSAFREAARHDPAAAEIWTRIGDVGCARNGRVGQVDASFARALNLDPTYAPAWSAKATCLLARDDLPGARAAARRAVELDPAADGASVLLARTADGAQRDSTRALLVALTLTASDQRLAWWTLAEWTKSHGDVALWVRSLEELARISPADRDEIAGAAEELGGIGELAEARSVAAAMADGDERPLAERLSLAARLAVDEATARGDAGAVRRRSTRVRLSLEEAAGRALLVGRRALARQLASAVAEADAADRGARLVLAVAGDGDLLALASDPRPGNPCSAATFMAFGIALARKASPAQWRAALAKVPHAPMVDGDDLVVRPAVELASRGALGPGDLPPNGEVELAALRGEVPPERLLRARAGSLDDRHRFLALALAEPLGSSAREASKRLAGAAATDPIIAAAAALLQVATGVPSLRDVSRQLLARDLSDPLLATTALRLAEKAGDHDLVHRARAVLTALGERKGAPAQ